MYFPPVLVIYTGLMSIFVLSCNKQKTVRTGSQLILLGILTVTPLVTYLGTKSMREHQYTIYFLLLCLTMAPAIYILKHTTQQIFRYLLSRTQSIDFAPSRLRFLLLTPAVVSTSLALLVSIGVVMYQSSNTFITPSNTPTYWFIKPRIVGNLSTEGIDAIKWAQEHTTSEERILVDAKLWNLSKLMNYGRFDKSNKFSTISFHLSSIARYACGKWGDRNNAKARSGHILPVFAWNGLFNSRFPRGKSGTYCENLPYTDVRVQDLLVRVHDLEKPGTIGVMTIGGPRTCIDENNLPDQRLKHRDGPH